MHIRLTGAHNAESASTRLAGIIVGGKIALDAGSLTRSLTADELRALRHVFVTHRHYDHIRDIPALAYGTSDAGTLHIYGLQDTLDALAAHLMNNVIYSAYQDRTDVDGNPRAQFHTLEPGCSAAVGGLVVTPMGANHTAPAVGFLVSDGVRTFYYTGDSGPGFSHHLIASPPDLLITEVTYSNEGAEAAARNGHMTPLLLRQEIERVRAVTSWTPRIVVVHRNPGHDEQISREIDAMIDETGWDITLGEADTTITL